MPAKLIHVRSYSIALPAAPVGRPGRCPCTRSPAGAHAPLRPRRWWSVRWPPNCAPPRTNPTPCATGCASPAPGSPRPRRLSKPATAPWPAWSALNDKPLSPDRRAEGTGAPGCALQRPQPPAASQAGRGRRYGHRPEAVAHAAQCIPLPIRGSSLRPRRTRARSSPSAPTPISARPTLRPRR